MADRRNFWGWGMESKMIAASRLQNYKAMLMMQLGKVEFADLTPPTIDEIVLPPPRITPPSKLQNICDTSEYERAGHSYGKSFRDVVRGLSRDFSNPPDVVAFPHTEDHITAILEWCSAEDIAVIPYGGGSSVTGGVEPPPRDSCPAVVSLDLKHFNAIVEIDDVSRAARIQGGMYGPALEAGLKPHGFTLRHFPQSFEFSTLGGWIATRAGGHFATLYTHIDDFVESVRMITPAGEWQSRRVPGSGAGPSPDRLAIGSEGALGVITEAWMRVQTMPRYRVGTSVKFPNYAEAVECVRVISQSGLYPSNCRLLDSTEAMISGTNMGKDAILLLAFESHDHPPAERMARALEICSDHNGRYPEDAGIVKDSGAGDRSGAAGAWRKSFVEAPYNRDALVRLGMITETFETAITWDRFDAFHNGVMAAVKAAIDEIAGAGVVSCRFTHLYPDGPAPYYTVIAAGKPGSQIDQWSEIKAAASDAVNTLGGTITHHHAVGRDHRPWYDAQRPPLFADALRAVKKAVDPAGILNPGILID